MSPRHIPVSPVVQDISLTPRLSHRCPASSLTLGTCLPGQYTLQYLVTNSVGQTTSSFLLVLVEVYASVGFSYTFRPANR